MVFALSPQAKGRVERTAGTFQDRLVTELRLSGATTIEEANVVLKEFLDRFNARFRVPAQHPEAAYRPLGSGVCLDTVLCFRHSRKVARDNTVKYRWRTLQLLPGTERPSYAGAVVEVLEGLDGRLAVRYQGEIVPSQEAPPRPGMLRSFNGSFLTRATHTWRSQRSGQALGCGPGSTRRGDGRLRCWRHGRRLRRCHSSKGRRHATWEAHSTPDGEVERCTEGPSAGACRFELSPGKWASTGTRRRNTWRPIIHPCTQIVSDRSHLLTLWAAPVTFMLAT